MVPQAPEVEENPVEGRPEEVIPVNSKADTSRVTRNLPARTRKSRKGKEPAPSEHFSPEANDVIQHTEEELHGAIEASCAANPTQAGSRAPTEQSFDGDDELDYPPSSSQRGVGTSAGPSGSSNRVAGPSRGAQNSGNESPLTAQSDTTLVANVASDNRAAITNTNNRRGNRGTNNRSRG
jgi:hypothetical protein